MNVIALDDDVAQVDADTQDDLPIFRLIFVSRSHAALDGDGAANSIHHACKFDQHSVAHELNNASAMG